MVIGLQSTGDSRTQEMISKLQQEQEQELQGDLQGDLQEQDEDVDNHLLVVDGFVSSPRQILVQLIENAFPLITIPNSLRRERSKDDTARINPAENKTLYNKCICCC